jgi:hypothetical protein
MEKELNAYNIPVVHRIEVRCQLPWFQLVLNIDRIGGGDLLIKIGGQFWGNR